MALSGAERQRRYRERREQDAPVRRYVSVKPTQAAASLTAATKSLDTPATVKTLTSVGELAGY